ncbi:hypothetical protein PAF17_18740 [Paracoccus sp. Z330]|uniref:Transposase DDE domain-containing protein n=1 Tax=Paracoccus onchidii TaxID=3017813 RepID=A0ABT4ZJH3_9RHOB|nr:hypothetical protein [Paracoccus onchidii]MDB6179519.1 hypothetical protein [Paracoccus onchidii]
MNIPARYCTGYLSGDRQVVVRCRRWLCATAFHGAMLFAQSLQRSNAVARF